MRRARLLSFVVLALAPGFAWAQGDPVGPEFRVNTYTTSPQFGSSVAADSSRNFVVVWYSFDQDGSYRGIFGQRYASSGTPLGPEFQVNTFTPSNQATPSVASDALGNFVVVWRSFAQDGSGYGVFGQRFASSGAPLGPEFRVNTFTTNHQGGSGLGATYPSVAADSAGKFIVVWPSATQDGSSGGIFGQRFASSGTPLGPEFRVNTYTTNNQDYPFVAADLSGNFVVVWMSAFEDGEGGGIFAQRYASTGASLGPEFRVNTYTTGYQLSPAAAADPSGNFVVVWASLLQDGSGPGGIYGQRYDSSGIPLGPEFRVNTYTTDAQKYPSVAADSSGNFVVVWQSFGQDGWFHAVIGQRFASSGLPLGPEFRVNTYTPYQQGIPSVAAGSAGDFVVTWTSAYQDGSSYGIFGQRYSQIVSVELMQFRVE
jgi:hypothetical protein